MFDSEFPWRRTRDVIAERFDGTRDTLLLTEREPPTGPMPCGVNETVNTAVCVGANSRGREGPLNWNALLLMLACERVMLVEPVLVNVSVRVCVFPLRTLPNRKFEGVAATFPGSTAVPFSVTVVEWRALPIEMTAESGPAECGVNRIATRILSPAGIVRGNEGATIVNSGLVTVAC